MRLEKYNPLTIFIYFISVLLITMVTRNPVYIGISFLTGSLYSLFIINNKNIYKSILIIILIIFISAITNPLFSKSGDTTLFKISNINFTLESLIYGLVTGFYLISIIIWFNIYNKLFSSDKFLYLFGNIFPNLSLILSMTLNLIPNLLEKTKRLNESLKVQGLLDKGFIRKIRNRFLLLGNLFSQTVEESITTALSMKARGYGLKGKTKYKKYKFCLSDILLILITLAIFIYLVTINRSLLLKFEYYPIIGTLITNKLDIINYCLFFGLSIIPIYLHIKEQLKWHYLKSRI